MKKLCGLLLIGLLAGCATTGGDTSQGLPQASGNVARAEAAQDRGDWQQAAAEWLALATALTGDDVELYRMRAVAALVRANDVLRARAVFDSIDTASVMQAYGDEFPIVTAELLLLEGRPAEALVVLPLQAPTEAELQHRFLSARAQAFAEQGALVSAIEDYTALNRLALSADSVDAQAWQFRLWPQLVKTDSGLLKNALRSTNNPEVAGWLRLGLLGQQEWMVPAGFDALLSEWEAAHALHSARAALLPALREAHARRQSYPQRIAILLPLTGRFAAAGEALRDGAIATWQQIARAGDQLAPELIFVDTESGNAAEWLAQLGESRGDQQTAVIGPLRKEKVDELLLEYSDHPDFLWLPLNQSSEMSAALPLALALSPEQEAELVADRISREGHRLALVIAAEGAWGDRVIDAFRTRFVNTGGKVVGIERYNPAQSDYGDTIQQALLLTDSELRHKQMTRALGRNIEFEPRRRDDVDAVFAPGFPRALRALRPQLKFHRASRLPVYATSQAWDGSINTAADLDLNGLRFASMPWNLSPSDDDKKLKQEIARAGGSARRGSFYALGSDAIKILPMLNDRDGTFPWVYPGSTGHLAPGSGGLLDRQLLWAEFVKGKPRLLAAPALSSERES